MFVVYVGQNNVIYKYQLHCNEWKQILAFDGNFSKCASIEYNNTSRKCYILKYTATKVQNTLYRFGFYEMDLHAKNASYSIRARLQIPCPLDFGHDGTPFASLNVNSTSAYTHYILGSRHYSCDFANYKYSLNLSTPRSYFAQRGRYD